MLSTRWQPLRELQTEMNRWQDEMQRVMGRTPDGGNFTTAYPALDLWEDEGQLYVEAELPGLNLEDLEIYVNRKRQLILRGERKRPEAQAGTWHRQERGYGKFARSLTLPLNVDPDRVEARFNQGVLTITLPKEEDALPRKIEVKTD